jgi:predicted outer membrane repeat protein
MAGLNRRVKFAAVVLPLFVMAMAGLARATTTITVTSLNDTGSTAICVLRDAISVANLGGGTVNGCSAAVDTSYAIVFEAGLSGTITLGSTLPAIIGNLRMTGPTTSPGITISGNKTVEVMTVQTDATLDLKHLTIAKGKGTSLPGPGSGGILNFGTLTVTGCRFSGNSCDQGGGAIQNQGTLTVTNSTFFANTAPSNGGGAIENYGTATVTKSTFFRNGTFTGKAKTETILGGAILVIDAGTMTVTNCTFSGNSANGGSALYNAGLGLRVTNSTISGNLHGGAFYSDSFLEGGEPFASLKSTILANNTGGNCLGVGIVDATYNLSDDGTCGFSGTSENNVSNIDLDPAGLKYNGGPTRTIALRPTSAAIGFDMDCTDQAPNPVMTDQRSFIRPASPTICDTGAYEHDGIRP